jgi:ubiquinol-cytochrome c reductase cytochrome b subunit
MTTQWQQSWAGARLPWLGTVCAAFLKPERAREAPYLAILPTLIAVTLALLTISGAVEAIYYNPWNAFASIQSIMRGVNQGWLVHAYHTTGTTMLFALVYLLLFRGILTRSYRAPGELVWVLAVKLFAVLLLVGWLGFTLTGGAAAYWSLRSATTGALELPGFAGAVAQWFFGGPPGAGTLARLEVFHAMLALSLFLVLTLYYVARRAAEPKVTAARAVAFYPYYMAQYFVALVLFALIFAVLACFAPHLGQPQLNALPGDELVLPIRVPLPWYLTPIATIADMGPGVWGGIFIVVAALAVLFALPWLDRGAAGRRGGIYGALIWVLGLDVVVLGLVSFFPGWPGGGILTGLSTFWYFFHFLVLTPVVTAKEAK